MNLLSTLPISLRQLQYIVAIAEHGSFRRAAEACHVAQPSLSAQVAVAERALGVQLFERTGRRVRVPPAAAPLVAQARRILMAAGDLQELARQQADPFRGTLRLGVIPTICPYLLPDIAPSLARDYPDLTIDWSDVIFKGLVLKGIYGREMFETWYKMASMLQSGLDISAVITHRLPVQEYRFGFETMASGHSGKIILDWEA